MILICIFTYVIISFVLAMFVVYLTAKDKLNEEIFPFLMEDEPAFNAMITFLAWEVILLFLIFGGIAYICKKFFIWFYDCFKEN